MAAETLNDPGPGWPGWSPLAGGHRPQRSPHRYTDALLPQPSGKAKSVEAGCPLSQDSTGINACKRLETTPDTQTAPPPSENPGLLPSDQCKEGSWCAVVPLTCEAPGAQRVRFSWDPRPSWPALESNAPTPGATFTLRLTIPPAWLSGLTICSET